MDAFYASVEQRDDPALKGKPVAVGGGHRGVVAAASYEARKFGVRSAMPSVTAKRRCPELIFVKPRFDVYRAVSHQIRAIFADYTDLIEPLSLDEAYLDVTEDRRGLGSARAIAEEIRAPDPRRDRAHRLGRRQLLQVHRQAGVRPEQARRPVRHPAATRARRSSPPCRSSASTASGRSPRRKMERLGILTGADLAALEPAELEAHFGSSGRWYWRICRGIDEREVKPDRPYKSVSAERTFDDDLRDPERPGRRARRASPAMPGQRIERAEVAGRTVTLKVKFADFTLITRSKSFAAPMPDFAAFEAAGQALAGGADPAAQGHPAARPGPSFNYVEEDRVARRCSWDWRFDNFSCYKIVIQAAAIRGGRFIAGICNTHGAATAGSFWGAIR